MGVYLFGQYPIAINGSPLTPYIFDDSIEPG
jgi:hypothetical protein